MVMVRVMIHPVRPQCVFDLFYLAVSLSTRSVGAPYDDGSHINYFN